MTRMISSHHQKVATRGMTTSDAITPPFVGGVNREAVERLIRDICAIGNRYVGTEGERIARTFVEESFARAGLRNVRCESVDILNYEPRRAECAIVGRTESLRCVGMQYTANATVEARAVYLGRPASVEALETICQELPPLSGKVAVLHTYWPWLFADHLIARGIAAIVAISETPGGTISHLTAQLYPVSQGPAFVGRPLPVPGVTLDRDDGALLLAQIANGETRVRIVHEALYLPTRTANVVGEIQGDGAEYIVLGAHYDTQFVGEGAQDNATGLGALIAIAERWALEAKPHRTVRFVAFCAEEQGMWGATEYCRTHASEIPLTAAMINMDALAWAIRGQRALLADPSIADYAEARAREAGWPVEITTNASLLRAADLNPFIDAGVPACWFWLFPPQHPFYHSTGDVIGLLDMGAVTEVANVVAYTAHCLANDRHLELGRSVGLPENVRDVVEQRQVLDGLDAQLEALRSELSVMRVTLRLDVEGRNFPAIGEAVVEGAVSIRHDESLDQRGAATAQWVMHNRRTLVQPDLISSSVDAPGALIKAYGVKAQMLAPVTHNGAVVGWLSVHSARPRDWSADDERIATTIAEKIGAGLVQLAVAARSTLGWSLIY